jgi:hypothetical protein
VVTTQTGQIVSPTTISLTAHTYSMTIPEANTTSTRVVVVGQQTTVLIAALTVSGYLDYLSDFCITPRQATTVGSSVVTSQQPVTQQALTQFVQSNPLLNRGFAYCSNNTRRHIGRNYTLETSTSANAFPTCIFNTRLTQRLRAYDVLPFMRSTCEKQRQFL